MPSSRHVRSPLRVDPVFQMILDVGIREPAPNLPRRLTSLFRELSVEEPPRPADDIEDLIWALWISHEDRTAEETMGAAVEALEAGALDDARGFLDLLVEQYPDWSEAWNKRAPGLHRKARRRKPRRPGADARTRAAPFRSDLRLWPDLPPARAPE